MVVAEFGTGQVFFSLLWFFLFVVAFWLIITIFADIFRSSDLSGWGKAGWSIFVILLPFLGAFVYICARGRKMSEHAVEEAQLQDEYFNSRVQSAVSASSGTAQLTTLTTMKQQGVIDDAEFQRMKAKVVASA